MTNISLKTNPTQILQIRNILRDLGFSSSQNGTRFLNKAIQYVISLDTDVFILEEIYVFLSNYYHLSNDNIKQSIAYSIKTRDHIKSKNNFEKVFNYEYDDYVFFAKSLIEEIAYKIK